MVVLIEAHLHRPFLVGIIRNKKVRTISNKKALVVKNTVLTKDPHDIAIEPFPEGSRIGVFSSLAQIVRIAELDSSGERTLLS